MVLTIMNNKIFDGIVKFVSIKMMDNFSGSQGSAQMDFHNVPVFIDSFAIDRNNSITLRRNTPFTISRLFANKRIAISLKPQEMPVAESMPTNSSSATVNCADILHSMLGEFASFISFNAVHDLPSLLINIPQMQMDSKRDDGANGMKSGKPKSDSGYGNPEPSQGYTPGRCRDYRRGKVLLITGESVPLERDDIVQTIGKPLDNLYPTDADGVSIDQPAARAASAGFAAAGVAAEAVAAGDYGLVQVYGYHSATRVRNMTGGAPAMVAGSPLALNDAGSVWCLENFDTGSINFLVYPCAFAIGKTTKWTTAAVAVFVKAL